MRVTAAVGAALLASLQPGVPSVPGMAGVPSVAGAPGRA